MGLPSNSVRLEYFGLRDSVFFMASFFRMSIIDLTLQVGSENLTDSERSGVIVIPPMPISHFPELTAGITPVKFIILNSGL